ncbi:MAG: hypothetical protein JXA03_09530 [Bacteroidales bacterium]|nr:hypothetical protein [Bacteroidales bacterium]
MGDYYNEKRIEEMSAVGGTGGYPDKYEPKLGKNYLRRHFDGDLTVELEWDSDDIFYYRLDGVEQEIRRVDQRLTIPRSTQTIEWGVRKFPTRVPILLDPQNINTGNVFGEFVCIPPTSVIISGQWRAWSGFLFWR